MRAAPVRQGTRVLLASFIPTHFVELIRLARALRDAPQFHPLIAFAGNYAERRAQVRSSISEDLDVVGSGSLQAELARDRDEREGSSNRTAHAPALRNAINRSLASVPLWVRRERAEVKRAGRILDEAAPDVVVLAEDNAAYPTANWIAAAHQRGIPVVIIPYTVASAKEFAETLMRDRAHWLGRPANFLAGSLFGAWVYDHRGRKLVRLPAARLLAKELTGLAPPRPWTLHSGSADAIAVESPRMLAHYEAEGLPAAKLHPTGSLADDALAHSLANRDRLRVELAKRLSLPHEQPVLLCALPPDQFIFCRRQTDFESYRAMVGSWVRALGSVAGWGVIIRPHPRDQERLSVQVGGNVRVSFEDTASLVPLCDVYVASVSATIRWAIGCGLPVLNFDCYRLRYGDYDDVPGVLRMETEAEFRSALRRVTADAGFRAELAGAQHRVASDWALLDGRSGERVLALLAEVARRPLSGAAA